MHFLQCTRLAVCLAVRIFRNWSFARSLRICNFGLGMRVILAQRAAKAIRIIGCACFGFLLHRSSEVMAKSSRLRSRNQQSRLPAIKRFAKRQSAVAFKTVTCDQGLVIRGGLTKKPIFMPTVDFQGRKFTRMSKKEPWLCQAAAGKASGLNPLSRTSLIETLRQLVEAQGKPHADSCLTAPAGASTVCAGKGGSMLGLGLDDDEGAQPSEASKRRGAGPERVDWRAPRKRKSSKKATPPQMVEVQLPEAHRSSGAEDRLRLLTRPPGLGCPVGTIFLEVEHVPWAVHVLHQEVQTAGVRFQPEETKISKPYYHHRDRAWQARAVTPAGDVKRRCFVVASVGKTQHGRRRPRSFDEFAAEKAAKLVEAEEWMRQVKDGEIWA